MPLAVPLCHHCRLDHCSPAADTALSAHVVCALCWMISHRSLAVPSPGLCCSASLPSLSSALHRSASVQLHRISDSEPAAPMDDIVKRGYLYQQSQHSSTAAQHCAPSQTGSVLLRSNSHRSLGLSASLSLLCSAVPRCQSSQPVASARIALGVASSPSSPTAVSSSTRPPPI